MRARIGRGDDGVGGAGSPAARGSAQVVVDALLSGVAIASILLGFRVWLTDGVPSFSPVSAIGLLSVPLLVRLSLNVSRESYALTLGLAPAVIFAGDLTAFSPLVPLWSVIVIASYLTIHASLEELTRASMLILGGNVIALVAPAIDLGFAPYDVGLVTVPAYLLTLWLLQLARHLSTRREAPALFRISWQHAVLAAGALYFCSMLFGVLWLLDTAPEATSMTAAVTLALILLVVALLLGLRSDDLGQGVRALSEASIAMPWPPEQIEAQLVDRVFAAVRCQEATIQDRPGDPKDLSVEVDPQTHVVLKRGLGDVSFTRAQRRTVEALAAMAIASRAHASRERQLRRRVVTDDLTGLWTYSHFRDLLEAASRDREEGETIAVLFLDLDGFKELNEQLGHLDADQVLKVIAERLAEFMPEEAFPTRFGGDEFAMIVRQVDGVGHLDAERRRIANVVAQPISVGNQLVQVKVTIGSAVSPDATDDIDRVIRSANDDMRRRKQLIAQQDTSPRWANELALLRELLKEGRIQVAYQPIIDLRTARLHGYEALLRASDEEFGAISPLLLVRAAERLRLLDELSGTLADQAIPAVSKAAEIAGTPLALAINIEFDQLNATNSLISSLPERLVDSGIALTLELSERHFGRWGAAQDRAARALRADGIALAIDDFGAGYSTFSLLNSWDWDWVKIDRSLISGRDDPQGRLLLRHISEMLRDLHMTGVAEGIETQEQLARVQGLGLRFAQGNHLGFPVPIDDCIADIEAFGVERAEWQV